MFVLISKVKAVRIQAWTDV